MRGATVLARRLSEKRAPIWYLCRKHKTCARSAPGARSAPARAVGACHTTASVSPQHQVDGLASRRTAPDCAGPRRTAGPTYSVVFAAIGGRERAERACTHRRRVSHDRLRQPTSPQHQVDGRASPRTAPDCAGPRAGPPDRPTASCFRCGRRPRTRLIDDF